MDLLLIDEAEPSQAHLAFARLPFDIVVTTNADFLLESAYQHCPSPMHTADRRVTTVHCQACRIHKLAQVSRRFAASRSLIMAEEDYDGFLRRIVLDQNEDADRETILPHFFAQLRDAWDREVLPDMTAPTDAIAAELRRE